MKLIKKVLPLVASLVIFTPTVFAGGVDGFVSQSNADLYPSYSTKLVDQYPDLAPYIVNINESVEVEGTKFTIEDALKIDGVIKVNAKLEKVDGTQFETELHRSSRLSLQQATDLNNEIFQIIMRLISSMEQDVFEVITPDDWLFLSSIFGNGSGSSSSSSVVSDDGKSIHYEYTVIFEDTDSMGSDFKLKVEELGFWDTEEQALDLELYSIVHHNEMGQILDKNLIGEDEETAMELKNKYSMEYALGGGYVLDLIQHYENNDGDMVLSIIYTEAETNGNLSLDLKVDDSPIYGSGMWGMRIDDTYINIVEYIIDDISNAKLVVSTSDFIPYNIDGLELNFSLPNTEVPTLETAQTIATANKDGSSVEIRNIKINPLRVMLEGSIFDMGDRFGYVDLVEVQYNDGTTLELQQCNSTGSYNEDYTVVDFEVGYELLEGSINLDNVEAILVNGMSLAF
ncbi:MAG: hypothetical protein ATN36_08015 [Epulopiscium sp. Nele67-Bin005]|nr:MAG: hypothetical protein ATN36_08015 [Epulopiscium sp. Nele67-Bin005]